MLRLRKEKGVFDKEFIPNWSEEHLLVQSQQCNPRKIWKLTDKGTHEIKGSWYAEEGKLIEKNRYPIEKVIRKRTLKGVKELLVKVKVCQPKFNTSVPE